MSSSRQCDLLSFPLRNPGLTGFNGDFKFNWFSDFAALFFGQNFKIMCCSVFSILIYFFLFPVNS